MVKAGQNRSASQVIIWLLAAVLLVSVVVWIKISWGLAIILAWSLTLALVGWKAPIRWQQWIVQLLGIQATLSTYRQIDYLFMKEANVTGQVQLSDTGAIAHHLPGPHWFWALFVLLLSAWIIL